MSTRTWNIKELVTDEEIEEAKGYANFGPSDIRELIKWCLMKTVCDFSDGGTITHICRDLGLLTKNRNITKKGKHYLWLAFREHYKS